MIDFILDCHHRCRKNCQFIPPQKLSLCGEEPYSGGPILARNRQLVLLCNMWTDLAFSFNVEIEVTAEDTSSNWALPLLSCSRMVSATARTEEERGRYGDKNEPELQHPNQTTNWRYIKLERENSVPFEEVASIDYERVVRFRFVSFRGGTERKLWEMKDWPIDH